MDGGGRVGQLMETVDRKLRVTGHLSQVSGLCVALQDLGAAYAKALKCEQ